MQAPTCVPTWARVPHLNDLTVYNVFSVEPPSVPNHFTVGACLGETLI